MKADDLRTLPSGTLTFFFTDLEGSTKLVRELGPDRFGDVLDLHGRLLRAAVRDHGGREVRTEGDSFFCVFSRPSDAVVAAADAQRALAGAAWPHGAVVRVRMGMHTGEGALATSDSGSDYVGFEVHRAARIAASGHGGQVLLSETTRALAQDGLPPGATLRDLGEHRFKDLTRPERVFQLVLEGLAADFPRLRSLDRTPNNLPTMLTSFVGRQHEIAEGRRLLGTTRLLTLTGPGGTGKTRLSLQIAAASADDFPEGVYFVPLASIVNPELVLSSVAHEVGVTLGKLPALDALAEHFGEKRVLLMLDNFEQILAAAPDVAELLRRAGGTKVLTSSRAPLRVYGEQELPVPPLALPDPTASPEELSHYEAVRLFIERAVATKPGFAVTNENAPAVAAICARLDGLPLAIELAAARVRLLPPQAILARLEKSLTFLAGGSRDLPARQQTLRGAIAWSYDLLDEPVRQLFRRFACFANGAELDEIEAVCGQEGSAFDGLTALSEHSLVRQREDAPEPRFFMLQTIREYAEERLAEDADAGDVHRRHAEAYLALVERTSPSLMGAERKASLDRLEREIDNIRGAVSWSVAVGATETALRLGAASWRFLQMRGYLHEARSTIERILAMPGADTDPSRLAAALEAAGGIAYWQGDIVATENWYGRCLAIRRAQGDERELANACYNLSFAAWMGGLERGKSPELIPLVEEATAIYRRLGDKQGLAKSLWAQADIRYFLEKDREGAVALAYEALALFREVSDEFGLGWCLHQVGSLNVAGQRLDIGRRELSEGLALFAKAGDVSGIVLFLGDFSRLAAASGDVLRGVRLAGAAATLQRKSGADLAKIVNELEGTVDSTRHPSSEEAAAAWAEGQAMTPEQAVAYALGGNEPRLA